ncbi:MAG: hypothetical protein JWP45_1164 [Mucilaginibacter sp.]|nr:hypothetical protein [Mucilaginibacter sp.]
MYKVTILLNCYCRPYSGDIVTEQHNKILIWLKMIIKKIYKPQQTNFKKPFLFEDYTL